MTDVAITQADQMTVLRARDEQITNLQLVNASLRRQLVEAQAALAAKGPGILSERVKVE